ncbi:MAG: hypothetical protein U9M92_03515 [Patescibacteria group bacterium]|nr:hypothetical protein [Patescibacteria group bacterium]
MSDDGTVDTSVVEAVFGNLKVEPILVKSTIPPGTTDELIKKTGKKIAFSPEFVGEGGYVVPWWKNKNYPDPHDMTKHDFQIIGGEKETTKQIVPYFQRVLGPEAVMAQTDAKTAELCKYMENSFIATKVTFCNEFAMMAEALGVDYNELRELWLLDGRVSRMFTAVFPDKRGFGGKCLPKDVNGIIKRLEKAGYDPKFMQAVLDNNERLKTNQG